MCKTFRQYGEDFTRFWYDGLMLNSTEKTLQELENALIELNSTSLGRRAFIAGLPALMLACAAPQHRQREGNDVHTEMTPDDERKMTREALPDIQKQYPPLQNDELQKYLNQIGRKLVVSNGLNGNPYDYNFTVVQANFVNAFALPAGTIFVTAPLLAMADTEAELAGVVGHEIGHVKAKHAAQRMEAAKKQSKKSILYGIGGGILGGAAGFGLGKMLCKKEDSTCMAKVTALGAAAGAGGGLLIQKFAFMANSREDEMEADRIGYKVAVASGYSKDHAGGFYTKLQKMEEERAEKKTPIVSQLADALATHPPSKERVAAMHQLEAETQNSKNAVVSTKEFDRVKKLAAEWSKANVKS